MGAIDGIYLTTFRERERRAIVEANMVNWCAGILQSDGSAKKREKQKSNRLQLMRTPNGGRKDALETVHSVSIYNTRELRVTRSAHFSLFSAFDHDSNDGPPTLRRRTEEYTGGATVCTRLFVSSITINAAIMTRGAPRIQWRWFGSRGFDFQAYPENACGNSIYFEERRHCVVGSTITHKIHSIEYSPVVLRSCCGWWL